MMVTMTTTTATTFIIIIVIILNMHIDLLLLLFLCLWWINVRIIVVIPSVCLQGGPKKVSLTIFATTLSTVSQFS